VHLIFSYRPNFAEKEAELKALGASVVLTEERAQSLEGKQFMVREEHSVPSDSHLLSMSSPKRRKNKHGEERHLIWPRHFWRCLQRSKHSILQGSRS
jgi:hypothetical protein